MLISQILKFPQMRSQEVLQSQSFINEEGQRLWLNIPSETTNPFAGVRVCAHVVGVYPESVDDLAECILIACRKCSVATRLSSIDAGDG